MKTFLRSLPDKVPNANIVVTGDFNEFSQTRFFTDLHHDGNRGAREHTTRGTIYLFDQNSEQLDHTFVSQAIGQRTVEAEHLHVNNWSPSLQERVSVK
ncbi:hypothetical protein E1B28_012479 [Marasmius oreades]|uniref:Endonuclease/exonuclease/phosphatase domain-containing protein n=1 Tax=Marasmius oreades TaxID=181124 RepID=A0A9P7RSL6_9AGAR|nr:uncharacterized protein E1B28_012479 [Marasmius oreades]KAG7088491.1 hypothetical protein E1B28_012479 [Marasmius oreades]